MVTANQTPLVSDLRVRQESGGVAGSPTRFTLTLAFSDPDGDVSTMEVRRQDTGEMTSAALPDAAGKIFGLAEATFEITAASPGDVSLTVALVDAQSHRSAETPFVIGVQAPPPPDGESSEEALRKTRSPSLRLLGVRVRSR